MVNSLIKLELVYLPKGKYCVYPRMVYRLDIVIPPPPPILDWPKITFDWFTRHFRSIRYFFFFHKMAAGGPTVYIIFTKWLPVAILDDRKSLSISFLTIWDQYATFFSSQNGCRQPFGLKITFDRISRHIINTQLFFVLFSKCHLICAKNNRVRFFHYVLSMAMSNMKLIGEFMTQLETPQAFWAFLYKMATRGHFFSDWCQQS